MSVLKLTQENFDKEVMESKLPVLVDFSAPWCGYCRLIAPAVQEIAEEYAGRLVVGEVNIDDDEALSDQYDVMTIPSLFVFKNGSYGEPIVAPGSKEQILDFLRGQGAL